MLVANSAVGDDTCGIGSINLGNEWFSSGLEACTSTCTSRGAPIMQYHTTGWCSCFSSCLRNMPAAELAAPAIVYNYVLGSVPQIFEFSEKSLRTTRINSEFCVQGSIWWEHSAQWNFISFLRCYLWLESNGRASRCPRRDIWLFPWKNIFNSSQIYLKKSKSIFSVQMSRCIFAFETHHICIFLYKT